MIRLALLLAALMVSGAQAQPVIPLTQVSVPITISTATTTKLVSGAVGKGIYVTSFDFIAAGTTNVQFVYGTGSNCGTNQANLTGNYQATAQVGISKGDGTGVVLVVPAVAPGTTPWDLCIVNSNSVAIPGSLSYGQF